MAKISVLGSGSWGLALALLLHNNGHEVLLWSARPENARKLREVVEYAPLDQLLLETDSPYLAPVPYRGKRNLSLNIPLIVQQIAEIKHLSCEEVIEQTEQNAMHLFLANQ